MSIRLLIADDHPWVREGLRHAFHSTGVKIVGEAASGTATVVMAQELEIDAMLMDLQMPDVDGIETMKQINVKRPDLPILIYSAHDRPDIVKRCAEFGARGYLIKGTPRQTLVAAVIAVSKGQEVWGQGGRGSPRRD